MAELATRRALLLAAGTALAAPPAAVGTAGREAEAEAEAEAVGLLLTVERASARFYRTALRELALSPRIRLLATELLRQEEAHRRLLLRVARRRELSVDSALRYRVPASNERAFLRRAATLEETAVGAYLGSSAKVGRGELAEAIAGIVGVEARHAAAVLMQTGTLSDREPPSGALTRQQTLDRLADIAIPEAEPG